MGIAKRQVVWREREKEAGIYVDMGVARRLKRARGKVRCFLQILAVQLGLAWHPALFN